MWDEITYPFPSSTVARLKMKMVKYFHHTIYNGYYYLSMESINVSNRDPSSIFYVVVNYQVHGTLYMSLHWRHNGHDSVSNRQPHDCLLNRLFRLFRRRLKKTSKLRVTGLCEGNSPETGEFPAQMASYAKNISTWWRHHDILRFC